MRLLTDSKAIFEQLADTDGSDGVQTVIENHDAWLQNAAVMCRINAALRAKIAATPRSEIDRSRLALQQSRLEMLVTRLPIRVSSAS